jgi:ubiquitin-protein ligase
MQMLLRATRGRKSLRHNFEFRKVISIISVSHVLHPPANCCLQISQSSHFPDPDDTLNFTLTIEPDEGMYKGGRFFFTFAISQGFPHEAPKVKCTQKIYHPNIDLEGNVCLNILREDWKPVLNLNAIVVGLQV